MSWEKDQEWESNWWGDCSNTFAEETKQITYAHRMGLLIIPTETGKWPVYNLGNKSILDIGGGPVSILLKCINASRRVVIDPCSFPNWVAERYKQAGIEYFKYTGEEYRDSSSQFALAHFDECWIYNVLQHVKDPEQIIKNAKHSAATIRIFEWVDTPISSGHPNSLTTTTLRKWLGDNGEWTTEYMNGENDCWGNSFYGKFTKAK